MILLLTDAYLLYARLPTRLLITIMHLSVSDSVHRGWLETAGAASGEVSVVPPVRAGQCGCSA